MKVSILLGIKDHMKEFILKDSKADILLHMGLEENLLILKLLRKGDHFLIHILEFILAFIQEHFLDNILINMLDFILINMREYIHPDLKDIILKCM